MTRVVKKQRVQIGTLKALGFKNGKITAHYVGYGFWISVLAGIVGFIAGPLLIGTMFIKMEMSYFEVPNGRAVVEDSSVIVALVSILIISLVTYLTCRSELKESPAETLREKMPTVKGSKFASKGIFKKMKFSTKWNLRDILRNKMRTLMGIVGITSCTMILTCAFGLRDTMNNFMEWQFEDLYNFDYKLSLKADYTDEQFKKLTNEYGTETSETLGIEIENGDKKEANNAFIDDSNGYIRFTDGDRNYVNLKDDGVFVTRKLAKTKGYKVGDTIRWHIYGDDTYHESKIVGLDSDPQNQNIKMTRKYLESLGVTYRADSLYTNQNLKDVKDIDGVEVIQDKVAIRSGMNNMLNTMQTMIVLLIVIASLLGIVIIYNLGVLSFSEKQYQFATLKVLGFKNKQIRKIYIKQNNWITIISIIIGLPAGFFLADYIFKMAIAETYDMPAHINMISYVYALVGTVIVSWISSHMLSKKVEKTDATEITREEKRKIEYKFIGILFRTYIIVEINDEIYLIDQHAAHERILYEQIKANYKNNKKISSQMMLIPEIINLSHREVEFVKQNMQLFKQIGFELETFGENTIKINGIPNLEYKTNSKNIFMDILDEMLTGQRSNSKDVEERFIATVACKAAVKAHMDLKRQEVDDLINGLLTLKNPYTCPHGRPTTIKISHEEIIKKLSQNTKKGGI